LEFYYKYILNICHISHYHTIVFSSLSVKKKRDNELMKPVGWTVEIDCFWFNSVYDFVLYIIYDFVTMGLSTKVDYIFIKELLINLFDYCANF
jgi:hypothetical protein